MKISERERDKYQQIWNLPAYHEHSPGRDHVEMFWSIADPQLGQSVLDIGAGSGTGSRALADKGLEVIAVDLIDTAWDKNLNKDIEFFTSCIWKGLPTLRDKIEFDRDALYDYAYCCDVMEHIPTEFVGLSVDKILRHCSRAFFSISFLPDQMGALIGQSLHLTVRPFTWWRDMFREIGTLSDARDLLGEGVFYLHE